MDKFLLFFLRIGLSFIMAFLFMMIFRVPRDGVLSLLMVADIAAKDNPSLFKKLTDEPLITSDSILTKDGRYVHFDDLPKKGRTTSAFRAWPNDWPERVLSSWFRICRR